MLAKIKENRAQVRYLRRFAEANDFVEFGRIKNNDHIERMRGVTFSPDSSDNNYMHATINGYETTFFTRNSSHRSLEHGSADYSWTVLSVELKVHTLPHIIFDNKKHDKRFYNSVFTRFPKLRTANQILITNNVTAEQNYDLYMAPETMLEFSSLFSDEMLQRMTYYYGEFDIELSENRLYVFVRDSPASYIQLKEMLNEALWLAERLEMRSMYNTVEEPSVSESQLSFVSA